jgi:hypothetical protein
MLKDWDNSLLFQFFYVTLRQKSKIYNSMCKKSCLECKNYKWSETKVVGRKLECDGMISVPVYKEIPHHCDVHPRYFKKWWKENSSKRREDDDYVEPRCYEPTELAKSLDEMIGLAQEILDDIKKKKGE